MQIVLTVSRSINTHTNHKIEWDFDLSSNISWDPSFKTSIQNDLTNVLSSTSSRTLGEYTEATSNTILEIYNFAENSNETLGQAFSTETEIIPSSGAQPSSSLSAVE